MLKNGHIMGSPITGTKMETQQSYNLVLMENTM